MKKISNFNFIDETRIKLFSLIILLLMLFTFGANQALAAGVSLAATPTSNTVTVGQTATYTIKINRDGYTDKVTLSATGLPAGVTATFSPNTTTATSSTLKLQTSANTPIGTFNINVKGTANAITIAPIVVKLITIAAPSIAISATPAIAGIIAGQSTVFDIKINRTNFDGALTFFAENLPSGVTVQFEPPVTTGNSARMYLYSNALQFIENTYGMLIVGTDNTRALRGSTPIKVEVNCGINWAQQFGVLTNQAGNTESATAIGYDAAGNLYAAGRVFLTNFQTFDIWAAKYSPNGAQMWVNRFSYNSDDLKASDLAVDEAGNIYVSGYALNNGDYNIFFIKIDNNGNLSNILTFGTNAEDGVGIVIGVDNVAHTVSLTTTENIRRPLIGGLRHVSFEITQRIFDSNFNTGGAVTLVNSTQGIGNVKDIAVAADGSVYFVGEGLDDPNRIYSIVAKFLNGAMVWRHENRTAFSSFTKIAVDANGNAFVVDAATDVNLLAFDSAGNQLWTQREAANNGFKINTLAIDGGNNVYYGATNGDEIFFRKRLGSTGAVSFNRIFRINGVDNLNDLKVDSNGILYLAADTFNFTGVNFGNSDALVMKYAVKFCFLLP